MIQPTPETPDAGEPPARRRLAAAAWVGGFGLCALPVFLGLLNHDVAWYLHAAGRVLAGRRLYVDVVEINPPLIVWLNFAPIGLARAAGISEVAALRLLVLGLVAGSLLATREALRLALPDRPSARRPTLALALFALVPLAGYDFGQREHLMFALFLPYLVLASARARGRAAGVGLSWAVGLMAGVGLALKPHFALPWVAVEAWLAWETRGERGRGWRWAWPRPEVVAVVASGLAYAAAVLAIAPEYRDVVRWARPVYAGAVPASLPDLLGRPATGLTLFALLGFAAVRPRGDGREGPASLLVAALGLLGIAFLQAKGFPYHFYPPLAAATIAIGLLAAGPAPAPASADDRGRRRAVLLTRGVLAAVVILTVALRANESRLWRGRPGESDTDVGRMIRLARGPGGEPRTLFVFSPAVAASFPLVTYAGAGWASRHPCLWFLTALHPAGLPASKGPTPAMGRTERHLFDSVVADLLRDRPDLLIVDEAGAKPAFGGGRFDFLAYYSRDPGFAAFLRDYEPFDALGPFRVYRRTAPAASTPRVAGGRR